jgi:RNA polymerase sigma-70 factor (ECF subfamily)
LPVSILSPKFESLKRYMFQTGYSIVAGFLRRSRVVPIAAVADLDQLSTPAQEVSAEQDLIFREELKDLAEALISLSAPCREAFALRRLGGLSQRETAERLNVSEKTKYMAKSVRLLMDRFGRGRKTPSRPSRASEKPREAEYDQTVEPGRLTTGRPSGPSGSRPES